MKTRPVQYLGDNTMKYIRNLTSKMYDAKFSEHEYVNDVEVISGLTAKYGSFNLNTVQSGKSEIVFDPVDGRIVKCEKPWFLPKGLVKLKAQWTLQRLNKDFNNERKVQLSFLNMHLFKRSTIENLQKIQEEMTLAK